MLNANGCIRRAHEDPIICAGTFVSRLVGIFVALLAWRPLEVLGPLGSARCAQPQFAN
jgi:hypothetical protein